MRRTAADAVKGTTLGALLATLEASAAAIFYNEKNSSFQVWMKDESQKIPKMSCIFPF
jgi:hypothetical protein